YRASCVAQRIANLTLDTVLYLSDNEFTRVEQDPKIGTLLWPDWHYGVVSMYGTHLTVNHLLVSEKLDIKKVDELLDQSTTNENPDDLEKNHRLHLHCWHTDKQFSKFQFKAENYNHIDPRTLINDTLAQSYTSIRISINDTSSAGAIFTSYWVIILTLILIAIVVFRQPHTQILPYIQVVDGITEQANINNNEYFPRIHQPLSSSLLRGIIIFYPHDQEIVFFSELLWLYHSWIEMMKNEPSSWRTDLVIYTGNFTLRLQRLGCVYNRIRTNKHESPQCRVFPYQRVYLRDIRDIDKIDNHLYQQIDIDRSILLKTHLQTYEYIDSINIIAECYPSFAMYDYILRTDIDVFLTPHFGHFVPYNDILLAGRGGYSTTFNTGRLRRIAHNMNWLYANITNIGSTWYGPPLVAQRIANFSLEAMLYLSINEFTIAERQRRTGILLWPDWYYGVLLLYGCELAINHLRLSENINIGLAHTLLDQSTTNKDPYDLEKNNRLHLHCWHTQEDFSKFSFKAGKYNRIHPRKFINDTSASGFAMRMALESRLMSYIGLKEELMNAKNPSRL
ncbi:unnamed protein product, partial [Rotaria sp. Silwood2]